MKSRILELITLLLLLNVDTVYAHKVNMFTYIEGEQVFVEGYFTDGKGAMNSEVTVYDPSEKELWKGVTDKEGQLSFPIPAQTDLRIVLRADQGHQTEYTLTMAEISGDENAPSSSYSPAEQSVPSTGAATGVSQQELERSVEQAVGRAIRPLMRSVSELKESKSLSDIVGGIGFIFGIMGLFFYVKARKQNNKN